MRFIENYYVLDAKNINNNYLEIVSVLLKIMKSQLSTMHYKLTLYF